MASGDIFDFLNDVWDLLPESDRLRFGELWRGYEQTYGAVWAKLFQRTSSVLIDSVPRNDNSRWIKHTFDSSTRVSAPASVRGTQDLGKALNLSIRYLLKVSVDGAAPVEIDLRGATPSATKAAEIVERVNRAVGFKVATLEEFGTLLRLTSPSTGSSSSLTFYSASVPTADAVAVVMGFNPTTLPLSFPKFRYSYKLFDRSVASIPELQDKIHDELVSSLLKEGIDFEVTPDLGLISFVEQPQAPEYWAKNTFLNKETPYNNFGHLLDLYDTNSESYLKAVQGLWFAFWTGPRPENIRRSIYLLFGLPTASQAGTVTEVSEASVALLYEDGTSESFAVPAGLAPEVALNETVTRFQPLVSGIRVYDRLNSPGFLEREIGRPAVRPFLVEGASQGLSSETDESKALRLLEQNTYLPQIDVNAFVRPDIKLSNVKTFLKNIQPKSRTFLLQILVGIFSERLSSAERLALNLNFAVTPNINYNPNTDAGPDARLEAELNDLTALHLDSEGILLGDALFVTVTNGADTPTEWLI